MLMAGVPLLAIVAYAIIARKEHHTEVLVEEVPAPVLRGTEYVYKVRYRGRDYTDRAEFENDYYRCSFLYPVLRYLMEHDGTRETRHGLELVGWQARSKLLGVTWQRRDWHKIERYWEQLRWVEPGAGTRGACVLTASAEEMRAGRGAFLRLKPPPGRAPRIGIEILKCVNV